jgi:transposase-like protein
MRQDKFKKLIDGLDELTPRQRQKVVETLSEKTPLDDTLQVVNSRKVNHQRCPNCQFEELNKWGKKGGVQRYRCKGCGKTCNALTGSPLARLGHRETWAEFALTMKDGLSTKEAGEICGVEPKTAFRWRHRWLRLPCDDKGKKFSGPVEVGETFFLESQKGSKAWQKAKSAECGGEPSRPPRQRGGQASRRGLSSEQIPVLVVRDRHGTVTDAVLPALDKKSIKAVLSPIMTKGTLLCTDGLRIYRTLAKEEGFAHQVLNSSAGPQAEGRVFHTQNINAYHSRLRDWLGRFRGVSTHYLPNYLGWRRMLEQNGDELTPAAILSLSMG